MTTATATKTLTIEVDGASMDKIAKAFNASGAKKDKILKKYAEVAVAQFTAWITGEKRYRSLTGQYIDWIETIYEEMLTAGKDRPLVAHIFNAFNVPYGQAAYICRVLNEKELTTWRIMGRQDLKKALDDQKDPAEECVNLGTPEVPLDFTISDIAEIELRRLSDQLKLSNEKFILPGKRGGYGQFRIVRVAAKSILELLEHPDLK
ncbi:MAG: hypothetical protein PVJ61_05455 [Dehalococcoidia bacterium]|jgi:hypothetical protein